jgi:hypothetical protein
MPRPRRVAADLQLEKT